MPSAKKSNAPRNYEQQFVPAVAAPLAVDLIDIASLRLGERVLDVACGTGIVARLAAEHVGATGAVAGVDINPAMLEVARSVMFPSAAIEWHEASAQALPFTNEAFDVVLCQMGLQFFPDKLAALRQMRRVLASEGRLLVNVPGPTPPIFRILAEELERHVNADAAGFVRQVFSLHKTAEMQVLVSGAGFTDISIRASEKKLRLAAPAEFLWQYVQSTPLGGILATLDQERRVALTRDVVARWEPFVEDDVLTLQLGVVVATARAL
jgi:ubiquinone/menaquinone biosynthesis C-methylase UbiE